MGKKAGDKLTDEQKVFVVQCNARFMTPSQVETALKEEFGVSITRQTVEGYDPTKVAGRTCAQKWKTIFEETRKAWIESVAEVGIAHRSTRLAALERMASIAEKKGNLPLAAALLKQAKEETDPVRGSMRAPGGVGITPPGQGSAQPGEFVIRFVDGPEPDDDGADHTP